MWLFRGCTWDYHHCRHYVSLYAGFHHIRFTLQGQGYRAVSQLHLSFNIFTPKGDHAIFNMLTLNTTDVVRYNSEY